MLNGNNEINKLILFSLLFGKDINIYPLPDFYNYLSKLDQANQIITIYEDDGKLKGFLTYYKIIDEDINNIMQNRHSWNLPNNFTNGDLVYIDLMITEKNQGVLKKLIQMLKDKEKNIDHAIWANSNEMDYFIRSREKQEVCCEK